MPIILQVRESEQKNKNVDIKVNYDSLTPAFHRLDMTDNFYSERQK